MSDMMPSSELLTRINVQAWDAEAAGHWQIANTLREVHAILRQRQRIVHDHSGHDYVIPVEKLAEWDLWLTLDPEDERSWDVPAYAKPFEGSLTFIDGRD